MTGGSRSQGGRTPLVAAAGSMLVAAVALFAVWLNGQDGATTADPPATTPTAHGSAARHTPTGAPATPAESATPAASVEPSSGLTYVDLAALPPEAADTVHLIDSGGPFPYDEDGTTFGNYEGLLPDEPEGYYKEYTVETPGSPDRGARRIVGAGDGQLYWTADHYASFQVIRRATP